MPRGDHTSRSGEGKREGAQTKKSDLICIIFCLCAGGFSLRRVVELFCVSSLLFVRLCARVKDNSPVNGMKSGVSFFYSIVSPEGRLCCTAEIGFWWVMQ